MIYAIISYNTHILRKYTFIILQNLIYLLNMPYVNLNSILKKKSPIKINDKNRRIIRFNKITNYQSLDNF